MTINPDNKETPPPLDKKQAEVEIGGILQYMATMGALSSEPADIQNILKQLHEGTVEPEAAVEMARQIERNRQENYH